MKARILLFLISLISTQLAFSQKMKVVVNDSPTNLYRSDDDGTAQIIIKSRIKDLEVYTNFEEAKLTQPFSNEFIFTIPITSEMVEYGENKGIITFKSNKYSTLQHSTIVQPNQRQYYNVYLPSQFPRTLSFEYVFSKSSRYGFRLSYGKQIGGFIEYHGGDYKKTGRPIESVTEDCNVTHAKEKGYIRQSVIGGIKLGLLYKDVFNNPLGLYALIGGGYGEYGRQWENPTAIAGNVYFYSDYMKGVEGEAAIMFTIYDWLNLSCGADALLGKGSVSVDYRIGCGINLNLDRIGNWVKRKKNQVEND